MSGKCDEGIPLYAPQGIYDTNECEWMLENLRQTSGRLQLATRTAKIGVWDLDIQNNRLIWDHVMYALYGIDPEQFTGAYEAWQACVHPEDLSGALEEVRMAIHGEKEFDTEFRIVWPNRTIRHIKANGLVQRDDAGRPIRMLGTNWDITERTIAEAKVRESEKHYRSLFESMCEGVALCRMIYEDGEPRDFIYLDVNEQFERLTGLRDVVGRRASEVIQGIRESNRELFDIYGRVAMTGEPARFETYVQPLDMWFFISVYSLEKGSFVAVFDVITERKRAEEERANLQSQLLQAQKMEAIGQLASGIAHDFNNVLTAIIGFGAMLELEISPEDPRRNKVSSILAAADRATKLTKSLLAFSRQQPTDLKPVNLNDIINGVKVFIPQVLRADIECRVLLSGEELTIHADSAQLSQVLLNFVTNARDAMPDGGELTISTMPMDMDQRFIKAHGYGAIGRYAVLTVTDTGIGMDEATRQKIFEPFFTTKEVGKGTGLGLSIIYGIVQQHGGYLTCYSELGIGSTFNVYLPLHEGRAEQGTVQNVIRSVGGTETILLAEDDDMVRTLFRTLLEEAGYRVIEAVNGRNAVQQYMDHRNEIALVILDLIMPKKNGREAYSAMREVNPQVRVIFTSGYTADATDHLELTQHGFDFISKPARPAELLNKVREVLDR